jgi:hypothetical protein
MSSEVEHDRYGRYLLTDSTGRRVPHSRATTIAKALDDLAGLNKWACRMTLLGLASRHDLYALSLAADATDRRALDRLADQAQEAAKAGAGANLGTALHALTAELDRGVDVAVPAPFDADLAAYRTACANAGIEIVAGMIERVVAVDDLPEPIAGTFDRIVSIDGDYYIADLKTAQTLDYAWLAISVQLSIYAHASRIYDDEGQQFEAPPFVDQHRALVIHLPAGHGECTLYMVDIDAGWEAASVACAVRAWRKRKQLAHVLESRGKQRADPVEVEAHRGRVRALPKATRARLHELIEAAEANGQVVRPSAAPLIEVLERHQALTNQAIRETSTGAHA